MNEAGMDIGNARIERPAKPITHAFIHFKNDVERNKFIRSANMFEKRFEKEKGSTTKDWDTSNTITTNWTMKYVSINGQSVVKTVQSGNLKYIKYQDVETEVEEQMQKWQTKNSSQRL